MDPLLKLNLSALKKEGAFYCVSHRLSDIAHDGVEAPKKPKGVPQGKKKINSGVGPNG